ncbi:MAG: STAS-like domain-containing protein [Beijerinckiaceae bacterium]|nr:STAS-like domain-containing protein [Beijerinckiaceae bacterium]
MRDQAISIAQVVGGGICVSASDGHRVHDAVRQAILKGQRAVISFSGVTRLTTAFLNAAIGQLYGEFPEELIRQHLAPVRDADDRQLRQLKLVVDRAKQFFADPDRSSKSFKSAFEVDDE